HTNSHTVCTHTHTNAQLYSLSVSLVHTQTHTFFLILSFTPDCVIVLPLLLSLSPAVSPHSLFIFYSLSPLLSSFTLSLLPSSFPLSLLSPLQIGRSHV